MVLVTYGLLQCEEIDSAFCGVKAPLEPLQRGKFVRGCSPILASIRRFCCQMMRKWNVPLQIAISTHMLSYGLLLKPNWRAFSKICSASFVFPIPSSASPLP